MQSFLDVTPYGSSKIRRFGGTYRFHDQIGKSLGVVSDDCSNWQLKQADKVNLAMEFLGFP
jgi:hypothetical protein